MDCGAAEKGGIGQTEKPRASKLTQGEPCFGPGCDSGIQSKGHGGCRALWSLIWCRGSWRAVVEIAHVCARSPLAMIVKVEEVK